jgi:hypothetical protein
LDEQGDMLLFQWGTYDWGDGPSFEYNITRQLIVAGHDEPDDAIWQLLLTVRYNPDVQNADIESGNRWCEHPSQVDTLLQFVETSEATAYARNAEPTGVELRLEQAG